MKECLYIAIIAVCVFGSIAHKNNINHAIEMAKLEIQAECKKGGSE